MNSGQEDEIIPIPYPTERDRRIYEPGYFHYHGTSTLDSKQTFEQREKFYRMEGKR